jgi:mannose-6-phosphate isomerase-like protein (cupin superfamily)
VQGVKQMVATLNEQGRSETQNHCEVYRPWGSYDSVDMGGRFQVKRISVKPGACAVAADAPPPRRTLDRGQRHRRSHL